MPIAQVETRLGKAIRKVLIMHVTGSLWRYSVFQLPTSETYDVLFLFCDGAATDCGRLRILQGIQISTVSKGCVISPPPLPPHFNFKPFINIHA